MSAAAAYKPAHGGYPGTVLTGAVRAPSRQEVAAELHSILCGIASVPAALCSGICVLVEFRAGDAEYRRVRPLLREAMAAWPEHSGDPDYPVADPAGLYPPRGAYAALRKWGDTPYGRARRRLLWHCIDWCESVMAE